MVRLSLKQGVTIDSLPHQLKVCGGGVLVVVPKRAPLCSRCKSRRHIRKDCKHPGVSSAAGLSTHLKTACVRTPPSLGIVQRMMCKTSRWTRRKPRIRHGANLSDHRPLHKRTSRRISERQVLLPVSPSPALSQNPKLKGQVSSANQSEQLSN
ncbi:unnamed protein product [Ixodes persulcatus]